MNKQTITKIISGLILSVFVMFIFQFSYTTMAATEASMSSLYSNPNQSGNNPYKFKVSDVVNSNLLTNIVGCTGVVNKVSTWMAKFVQSPLKIGQMAKDEIEKKKEQLSNACASVVAGTTAAGQLIPFVGGLADPIKKGFESVGKGECQERVRSMSDKEVQLLIDQDKATSARDFKEQCFDGIALTLARNQLTSMTRSAMNWVNTGYGGNPFFVQNMRNFTEGIERNVVETGIDVLLAPNGQQSPYASDFARSTIASRGIISSSSGFLGGLQSNLQNFITDPSSYYSDDQLDGAYNTRTALQNAQDANDSFSRSFMSGGWEGWLAFTQTPQNNPLGFNMMASQYLADQQAQQLQETKDELAQNDGFLSQKTCVKWQLYNKDGTAKTKNYTGLSSDTNGVSVRRPDGTLKSREELEKESKLQLAKSTEFAFSTTEPQYGKIDGEHEFGKCVDWKITTPGSIIRDKTTNYLNSPERQLELAKTINDSLNALFSVLISKLQGGGLSGLSDSAVTTNWTDSLNEVSTSYDGNTPYDNNGAYDGFNLTRDLGNTYIYNKLTPLGNWNAKDNCLIKEGKTTCPTEPKEIERLYTDLAPGYYDAEGKFNPYTNAYYTVSVAGKTKLILEGYNGWEVGDRAFWDGTKWQNWKKGQKNPIKIRGVVQIQQDYIVAAKEIMKVLPGIMPALGELDYCLPGPNPNYKINSSEHQTTFNNWIGSIYVGPVDTSGERYGVKIDNEGDSTFNALRSAYQNNNIWNNIISQRLGDIKHNYISDEEQAAKIEAMNIPDFVKQMMLGQKVDLSVTNVLKIFSNICNDKESDSLSGDIGNLSSDCAGNYTWAKNGELGATQADNIEFKKDVQEYISKYTGSYLFDKFYEIFDQKMNERYFKKMTNKYLEYENRPVKDPNPAYIKMAESGFDFTKNIVSYADDTINAQKDYAGAISSAKVNIAKLEPIKNEVSLIIKAAQDRRDAELIKIINEESIRTGRKDANGKAYVLKEAEYKAEYASCLDEENIKVFDIEDIVELNDIRDKEACNDGIDNDLDALIDSKDPDCGATTTVTPPRGRTNRSSDL